MTLNSVVLPAPLAPITARRSPAATENETSSIARSAPKLRVTPSSRSAFTRRSVRSRRLHLDHGQFGSSREPILNSSFFMPSIWLTLSILRSTLL